MKTLMSVEILENNKYEICLADNTGATTWKIVDRAEYQSYLTDKEIEDEQCYNYCNGIDTSESCEEYYY